MSNLRRNYSFEMPLGPFAPSPSQPKDQFTLPDGGCQETNKRQHEYRVKLNSILVNGYIHI